MAKKNEIMFLWFKNFEEISTKLNKFEEFQQKINKRFVEILKQIPKENLEEDLKIDYYYFHKYYFENYNHFYHYCYCFGNYQ